MLKASVKLLLNNFVKDGNVFQKKYSFQGMACICNDSVWQNLRRGEKLEAKKKDNEEATKIDSYAIAWTVKRKDKLVPVVVGHIPREISRFTKFFLNYEEELKRRFFPHNTNHPRSHQEGLKYPLLLSF